MPLTGIWRQVLESLPDGIIVQDKSNRCVYTNAAGAKICGFANPDELDGYPIDRILDRYSFADESGRLLERDQMPARRVLAGETDAHVVLRVVEKETGRVVYSSVRAWAIPNPGTGEPELAVSVLRDVTASRTIDENMRRQEALFRQLAETIPHLVWMTGPEGELQYCNRRWVRYTGMSLEESRNGGYLEAIHPDHRNMFRDIWRSSLSRGEPLELEYLLRQGRTHSYRWHLVKALPLKSQTGKIVRWFGTCTDIHEKMILEERQALLAEAGMLLSSSLDYETTIRQVASLAVSHLADWCSVDLPNEHGQLEALAIAHADPAKVQLGYEYRRRYPIDMKEKGGSAEVYLTGRSKLVSVITEDMLTRICRDEDMHRFISELGLNSVMTVPLKIRDRTLGVLTLISSRGGWRYDENDLAVAEELARRAAMAIENASLYRQLNASHDEAERARREAEAANRAKSSFLANMSHEIRTPLTAILGFTEVLQHGPASDWPDLLSRIRFNGDHLLRLIDDILDLSKVEAKELRLERLDVRIRPLVEEIMATVRVQADAKGLVLRLDWEEGIPESMETDPHRFRQILSNLLVNAIKFTEKGNIEVRVRTPETGRFEVLVSDTGIGIAEGVQKRLFRPFSQADETISRRFGGTGLGLILARHLARALGGELDLVSSATDKGSVFRFWLPMNNAKPSRTDASATSQSRGEGKRALNGELTGRKVLVVDDVADNVLLVSTLLRMAGVEVSSATDGEEAVAMALSGSYDVILMDIQMPVMDGLEATRKLRSAGYGGPIVALTAHAMKEQQESALAAGYDGYMTKPIKLPELVQTIRQLSH